MAQLPASAVLSTTFEFDIAQLYEDPELSPVMQELLTRLYQNLNKMALTINMKDTGFYITDNSFVTSQSFFPNPANNSGTSSTAAFRQVYRKVINFGTLPNNTTKSVAHNITITPMVSFTRIYGAATHPGTKFIPLPYVLSGSTAGIELDVTATNVVMVTTGNYSAYTTSYVVLEYLIQ